jgi:RNA polymerase sigma factor (sigma-70 family)
VQPTDDVIARLRRLGQEDWERMTVYLLKFAASTFLDFGIPVIEGAVRGVSIADLVHDAVDSVWSGRRKWDPEVALPTFLRNAVRSEMSNLLTSAEVRLVDAWPDADPDDEKDPAEDAMQVRHADPSHDHARHLPRRQQTPEEIVAETEQIERYHDLLLEAADDDEELIRYLDALDRGIEEPAAIAKEWGVDRKVIYSLENRLRKRVKSLIATRQTR